MRRDDAAEVVQSLIAELLGVQAAEVEPKAGLSEDLSVDSVDLVEIVLGLEEQFATDIPDEVAGRWRTVGDVIEWAKRQ